MWKYVYDTFWDRFQLLRTIMNNADITLVASITIHLILIIYHYLTSRYKSLERKLFCSIPEIKFIHVPELSLQHFQTSLHVHTYLIGLWMSVWKVIHFHVKSRGCFSDCPFVIWYKTTLQAIRNEICSKAKGTVWERSSCR